MSKTKVISISETLTNERDILSAKIDVAQELENLISRYQSYIYKPIVDDETGEIKEDLDEWQIAENRMNTYKIDIIEQLLKSL